jgi:hypothetical protein
MDNLNFCWLEKELWEARMTKIDQMHKWEIIEQPKPHVIARLMAQINNLMVRARQHLQPISQTPYHQTTNKSNI